MILLGNCLDKLKELPDNSVDSCVTDPPYELGFMGKSWDNSGIANNPEMWKEVLRVLKPGGHLLSFSGTRTYHRQAVAIEDAGFEIRDMVEWVYGSGFPKSLNIGKAVDKIQGNEREIVSVNFRGENAGKQSGIMGKTVPRTDVHSKGQSKWEGWGTALKPAHEPICLARKPIEGTVANNVLKWGTGGLNIDKSRVELNGQPKTSGGCTGNKSGRVGFYQTDTNPEIKEDNTVGRFPANFIHDSSDEVVREFPNTKSGEVRNTTNNFDGSNNVNIGGGMLSPENSYGDSGSAARFFKSFPDNNKEAICQNESQNNVNDVANLSNEQETPIAQEVVETCQSQQGWERQEELQAILACTTSCRKCIQHLSHAQSVEDQERQDIMTTMTSHLKSHGFAIPAITEYIKWAKDELSIKLGLTKSMFYQAKASKSERDRGCEGMELKVGGGMAGTADQTLLTGSGNIRNNMLRNNHPTVKPLALMKYLIQMITPEGGTVLDPFAGSGSTLVAAKELGYDFIGIEMTEEYIPIIEARLAGVKENPTLF